MYKIRLIHSSEEFAHLEEKWNTLLSRSPANNYFLRWEWLLNWWEVFREKGDELSIIFVEKGENEIVGIAPFYTVKRTLAGIYPVRRLMFLGTDEDDIVGSDYMDIIYKEGEEEAVIHSIFKCIAEYNLCDEIYFSKMNNSGKTFGLFRQIADSLRFLNIVFDKSMSNYISLPSTWEEYLNTLSRSMRYKIRHERRKIEKYNNTNFRKIESSVDFEKYFAQVVWLHQCRWASKGMQGAFSNEKFTLFQKKVMQQMLNNGHLELNFLSIDGMEKAVIYNIFYKNKIYFYLSGLDTSGIKGALGVVLHSHCVEEAIKKGIDEYDFLLKGKLDDYKDRWTKEYRTLADLYIAPRGVVKQYMRTREYVRTCYYWLKPVIHLLFPIIHKHR